MIRTTLTAHLAEAARQELTLQLNDRDIGLLATQNQRHYVMSGNRRVQMLAGFLTDRDDAASVMTTRALLRYWLTSFRELQINGLTRFPQCVERNRLDADFLLLMDSERVFVWCGPEFGVYLHRGRHLYRQQPTYPPQSDELSICCSNLDFYAFRPREGDDILIIDPAFIDLFDVLELEHLFSDIRQMNLAMTELTRLALSSGYNADTTWISSQIQKLEHDPEELSAESRERVSGRRGSQTKAVPWFGQIKLSKVVPLLDGYIRLLQPDLDRFKNVRKPTSSVEFYQPKPPKFTTNFQQTGGHRSGLSLKDTSLASVTHKDSAIPDQFQVKPTKLDRMKLWNTDAIRERFARVHYKLKNLVPGSRGLSILSYFALWLIVLVLIVSIALSIQNARQKKLTPNDDRPVVTTQQPSQEIPKTDFEIDVVVKASSLRILAAPGLEELVGTVTRGDHVTQLTNPKDGWVMVRLQDGRTGYVQENLLLSPDEGD